MPAFLLGLFCFCAAPVGVEAQTLPRAGEVYQSVRCDLNGDGREETIRLAAYNLDLEEESFWGRLEVVSSDGKVLWRAPQAQKTHQPWAFGMWAYGVSGIEWVGDLDGDGKIELLSPAPISDVRPPTFRRYRWNGTSLEALSPKMLLEVPSGSGRFAWRDPVEWDGVSALTWVSSLSGGPTQKIAEITSSRSDGNLWGGQAEMSGDGLGLSVARWLRRLGPAQ